MDQLLVDPPTAQLEELVSMVTSCQLYPEQFTSFRLAQRYVIKLLLLLLINEYY